MEEEGFVVGVKAFVRAIVEGLRAIRRFKLDIPIAIDGYEILIIEVERIAVWASKARPFKIDRSMNIHGILQSRRSAPGLGCFCNAPCEFHASRVAVQRFPLTLSQMLRSYWRQAGIRGKGKLAPMCGSRGRPMRLPGLAPS
jgi:hypothetical protein